LPQPHASAAEPASTTEHQIKAAFIYNFLKFVEWPPGRFANSDDPIFIGVVGKSSILLALETVVRDRRINRRDLRIKVVETPEAALAAHMLFIPAAEDRRAGELLKAVAGSSVLTVGESEVFAKQSGMISFVPEGDKIRFEINMESAERADLKISAQLLKLARSVRRKS